MAESYLYNPLEEDRREKSRVLMIIRAIFLVMLATATMLILLRELPANTDDQNQQTVEWFVDYWGVAIIIAAVLGVIAVVMDALTPRKKLSGITAIFFGLVGGLLATVLLSWVVELLVQTHDINIPKGGAADRVILAIKTAFAITLCYLGVSIVYSTQDEFRLIIPYVEFSKQLRGTRPLVLDTSAIIDGRLNEVASTGFITAPVLVPRFVIDELQTLADSGDRLKRNRGRRGLDIVRKMQNNAHIDLSIIDSALSGLAVDQMLVEFAREHRAQLVTTDFNLNKVASIHGVQVLNINDLANSLKPVAIPGEAMTVEIVKKGESPGQGVGYLDDGTMVVVEQSAERIGEMVTFGVTSSIQTSAGRMIFGDPATLDDDGPGRNGASAAASRPAMSRKPDSNGGETAAATESVERVAPASKDAADTTDSTPASSSSRPGGRASSRRNPRRR
ncbi:MAG: TRAM domain-containing protein [Phycisphaerales bacterium]